MTVSAIADLQETVFAVLSADTDLNNLVTGIYDEPIDDARYPYVAMGETSLSSGNLKDRDGARVSFDLMVWSDEPSQMQAKELMAKVDAAVLAQRLAVPGHDVVTTQLLSASVVRQWDERGSLYRGRLSYSAVMYASTSTA